MSSVIWKYSVPIMSAECKVEVPVGGEVISADQQGVDIAVWYIVPVGNSITSTRRITLVPTGVEFEDSSASYVATVSCHGYSVDPLVLHVFEEVC